MLDPVARLNEALTDRYRIERELGEGGMATVYLAEDLKHDRRVAIKVLKPELAAVVGAERFLAEIRTTANLQHPHILPLFDSGEADGFLFYVMPYVEGETLRDKLDREKQLPVDEAVGLATAVAAALQAAHEHGIVHRDIKPANILLSRGEPLVADFGIALAVGAAGGSRLTETGLSLGTPYYMSPEQATGEQTLGPATDQYALACVLYEMLAGDPPYVGSSAQAVLGKIIQGSLVPPTEYRKAIPPHVSGAILRALEKLPADRFASLGEFTRALSDPAFRYGDEAEAGAPSGWNRLTSAFAGSTVVFAALAGWALLGPEASEPVSRYFVELPTGQEVTSLINHDRLALTRDGARLVYVGPAEERAVQLWVRERDKLEAAPIRGTEGGYNPSLSPDESEVAYTVDTDTGRELRAIPLEGGPSRLLTDSLVDGGGVSWGYDGWVYYDGHLEGDGFARVPETGGVPERVTVPAPGETWHSHPHALPDGRGVLFYAAGVDSIGVVDTETGEHRLLVGGYGAIYARSGHLLWVDPTGTMMAAPFDQRALETTGPAIPLREGVVTGLWGGWDAAVSDGGTLAFLMGPGRDLRSRLVWVSPTGETTAIDDEWKHRFTSVEPSPEGERIAAAIREDEDASHIWVRPVEGGAPSRVTFDGYNAKPTWTPDGDHLLYLTRASESTWNAVLRNPDVTGRGRTVLEGISDQYDLSRDGRWLVFAEGPELAPYAQRLDAELVPEGERLELDFGEEVSPMDGGQVFIPELSPDGRWLAYMTLVEGRPRVEVRPFPNVADGRWPVSPGAAIGPHWSEDGTALFYRSLDEAALFRVPVTLGTTFIAGQPEPLIQVSQGFLNRWTYAVASDGRVLMTDFDVEANHRLVVVEGFFQELEERVGEGGR